MEYFVCFFYFCQKIGFGMSCKLSAWETIYMKCQALFSGENEKNTISRSSAELAQRMVKVNCLKCQVNS